MCAVLPIEGENPSYVRLNFSSQMERRDLVDTTSCAKALPDSFFIDVILTNPKCSTQEKPSFDFIRMTSGKKVTLAKQAQVSDQVRPHYFRDSFIFLPTLNSIILGNRFIKKDKLHIWSKREFVKITSFTGTDETDFVWGGKNRYTKKLTKCLWFRRKINILSLSRRYF